MEGKIAADAVRASLALGPWVDSVPKESSCGRAEVAVGNDECCVPLWVTAMESFMTTCGNGPLSVGESLEG